MEQRVSKFKEIFSGLGRAYGTFQPKESLREDNKTEVRELKSSSPIEVTQIDEKSSAEKPKKKGWWSK